MLESIEGDKASGQMVLTLESLNCIERLCVLNFCAFHDKLINNRCRKILFVTLIP